MKATPGGGGSFGGGPLGPRNTRGTGWSPVKARRLQMQCVARRNGLSLAVVAVLAAMSIPALAQESPTPPAAEPGAKEATTLSEIVVTAQKREEAMQDAPISVTALPEQLLQDTGVKDIKDLQVLVPGLTVTSTQNEAITTARI